MTLIHWRNHGIAFAKSLHSNALKSGDLWNNIHHATRILNAYCKCGILADAHQLFAEFIKQSTPILDVVCWNSIISGCIHNGSDEEAFQYFKQMQHHSDRNYNAPDSFTLSSIISSACCLKRDVTIGEQCHGYALKTGVLSSVSVGNALITLYARWGKLHASRLVLESMHTRNVVSWTAIITGHAQQQGHELESLKLFVAMLKEEDHRPNEFTFASVFSSCGKLASQTQGVPFIALTLKMGLLSNIHVQNSLLGFYSECSWMEEAKVTFEAIRYPDLVSWNSLLKGYSQQGMAKEALQVFQQMQGFETPDAVTFLSTLSACRHRGMVAQGLELFKSMKSDYGIEPQSEHISCIVDLMGRAGQLHKAEEFIEGAEFEVSASVWRTLLGVCQSLGQAAELAKFAASKLLELDPYDSEAHVVLSHVYAANGEWDMAKKFRRLLKEKGEGKEPGFSWIEVGNQVHSFVATDWGHPKINEIHITLLQLTDHIKGSIADISSY